jgi:hypothetical protein
MDTQGRLVKRENKIVKIGIELSPKRLKLYP